MIQGQKVRLRALEMQDLEVFMRWENGQDAYSGDTWIQPLSSFTAQSFIEQATRPIEETGQLRLMICTNLNQPIGFVDLFDMNLLHRRAAVGLLIGDPHLRNQGYGNESLVLISDYAFNLLNLHILYADIRTDNEASLRTFAKAGFRVEGVFPEWIRHQGNWWSAARCFKINPTEK